MREYARNIFRFNFRNDDVCFFVWIYEMEQFKLKVGRCFALISNHLWGFDLFVTGRRHFLLSERSLSYKCNDHTDKRSVERSNCWTRLWCLFVLASFLFVTMCENESSRKRKLIECRMMCTVCCKSRNRQLFSCKGEFFKLVDYIPR